MKSHIKCPFLDCSSLVLRCIYCAITYMKQCHYHKIILFGSVTWKLVFVTCIIRNNQPYIPLPTGWTGEESKLSFFTKLYCIVYDIFMWINYHRGQTCTKCQYGATKTVLQRWDFIKDNLYWQPCLTKYISPFEH